MHSGCVGLRGEHPEQRSADLSWYFAGSWKQAEPPPFGFVTWEGGPRLEGCIAALGCRMHAIHEGGDHWIVVGQVVAAYRTRRRVVIRGSSRPVFSVKVHDAWRGGSERS